MQNEQYTYQHLVRHESYYRPLYQEELMEECDNCQNREEKEKYFNAHSVAEDKGCVLF